MTRPFHEPDTAPLRLPLSHEAPPTPKVATNESRTPDPASRHPPEATPFTSAATNRPRAFAPTNSELGLVRSRPAPKSGWRKAIHRATGLNPGESAEETTHRAIVDRVNQPVRGGPFTIAVLSQKGGVGKTTTTVGLGATLAAIRGDRVVAMDANPDFGTLAQRGPDETDSTVRDVLFDDSIIRYSDMRRHTSQNSSRLEMLASERDPATSEAFSAADYRGVLRVLQRFYNIILTDCGTGLVHSAMGGVLAESDMVVIVASPAIDSARSALATLDWLERQGFQHLVPGATVVFSAARQGALGLDMDKMARHFLPSVRSLHVVPFDDHLAEGSEVELDKLSRQTRQAFLELAASIADGFAALGPSRRAIH